MALHVDMSGAAEVCSYALYLEASFSQGCSSKWAHWAGYLKIYTGRCLLHCSWVFWFKCKGNTFCNFEQDIIPLIINYNFLFAILSASIVFRCLFELHNTSTYVIEKDEASFPRVTTLLLHRHSMVREHCHPRDRK